jgi:hypothetical protein
MMSEHGSAGYCEAEPDDQQKKYATHEYLVNVAIIFQ